MRRILNLFKETYSAKDVIWTLALSDFKNKYVGSYFGLVWAIIQSTVIFVLYWVVFEFFLQVPPGELSVPFALWLMAGFVPWMFFSDALVNVTGTFQSYAFVVKKMTFKISVLPFAKILSTFFMSCILNVVLIVVFAINGKLVTIHLADILYYNICMFYLLTGLSFALSSINVFFRDTAQIIGILVQFGTWITPILWNYKSIPKVEPFLWVFKLNPMFYIVDGYRSALIDGSWFFERPLLSLEFWLVSTVIFFLGASIYVKLRPHFADVL